MNQTVQAALVSGTRMLRDAQIESASRDAQLLMAACLGLPADRLILAMQDKMNKAQSDAYLEKLKLRSSGVPVSQILRHREFYGRAFIVTSDVLDPRPETEILVNVALEHPFSNALDLGTGSGAIIISLLAERAAAQGVACDISKAALDIALQNAVRHGVQDRLNLLESDWFAALTGQFDLIVANPPYIALSEMPDLQTEVRLHEPEVALTDHGDGLSAYRVICAQAGSYCAPEGRILVEIGPTQAAAVSAMMSKGGFVNVTVQSDLDGRDRVVCAQKPAN